MTNLMHVYHHNDMDGIAAAAMIDLAYPAASKKFISTGYPIKANQSVYQFGKDAKDMAIFFVDLSFKNEKEIDQIVTICNFVSRVIWIDHHASSDGATKLYSKKFPDNFESVIDQSACGALLTYRYLHQDANPPEFLKLIDIHDRHSGSEKELELATSFHLDMLSSAPDLLPTSEIWKTLMGGGDVPLQLSVARGRIVYDYLKAWNEKFIASNAILTKVLGIDCICVNTPGTSILFDSVKSKFPLCLAWYFDGTNYQYSIYSDGGVDCSVVASKFGGGGHPGASGFSCDHLLFVDDNAEKYQP